MDRQPDRYLFLETILALLAFSLQQAASALRPRVSVGHDSLVAMDHALVAVVLGVGGREGGLVGGVGGMGVVLGLVSRWGQGHGQAGAGVSLARSRMAWTKQNKTKPQNKSLRASNEPFVPLNL